MNQENVRERLNKYIDDKGVRIKKISEKTGIPDYIITKFKNSYKTLWDSHLSKLNEFLSNEGF